MVNDNVEDFTYFENEFYQFINLVKNVFPFSKMTICFKKLNVYMYVFLF